MSSVALPIAISPVGWRPASCLLLLVPIPIASVLAELTGTGALVAVGFLCAGLLVATKAGGGDSGVGSTLLRIFFFAAAFHAAIGYAIAAPTSRLIWIGTGAPIFYSKAFVVISAGFLAAAVGYAWSSSYSKPRIVEFAGKLHFDDRRLLVVARIFIVPGIALIAFVYATLGILPILADAPGAARYFNYTVSDDYLVYEWLVSRGMDLLTFSLPLVAASALWNRNWLDRMLALAGTVAFLLPLRRANLMSVVVVLVLVHWMKTGKSLLRYATVFLVLLLAYVASQLALVNLLGSDFDEQTGFAVAGSALPEVRDLGWTMDLLEDERLYGATFLQALVPLPSFVSDFSQTHSLRAVTSQLIGLDAERHTGGLRLTLSGEAFLNFGYFGPVGIGFLFGIACSYARTMVDALASRRTMWSRYLAATILIWVCLWIYLSGTQSGATIKVGGALMLAALWMSRVRPEPAIAATVNA